MPVNELESLLLLRLVLVLLYKLEHVLPQEYACTLAPAEYDDGGYYVCESCTGHEL